MTADDFTKLFKFMQEEFGAVRKEIAQVQTSVDNYAGAVDAFAKQSETYMQEMLMLSHKVERLERWIMKIAEETGVKLVA